MRITGFRMLELAAQANGRAQADVAEVGRQLTSGKRVERASEDPTAWAQARRLEMRQRESEGRGEAMGFGRDQLVESERALAALGDILAESKQLAVQAANGSLTSQDRTALAERARGLFTAALAAGNTKNAAGEYVFAGSVSTTEPFDATGAFLGDGVTRSIELGDGLPHAAALSGASLTATAGIDVFPAIARFATALAANDTATIQTSIDELGIAHRQVNEARGQVGSMQAVLDETDRTRSLFEQAMATRASALVDVDLVEGASDLTRTSTALEAAQAVQVRLAALLAQNR